VAPGGMDNDLVLREEAERTCPKGSSPNRSTLYRLLLSEAHCKFTTRLREASRSSRVCKGIHACMIARNLCQPWC
jgi:hypothetical protein